MRHLLFISAVIVSFSIKAAIYPMPTPGNDLIGEQFIITIKSGDTIYSICQKYSVSQDELWAANPKLTLDKLATGSKVTIPAQHILPSIRQNIVINTAEERLYFFTPDGKYVFTIPLQLESSNITTMLSYLAGEDTPRQTINEPEKVGVLNGKLYLESHLPITSTISDNKVGIPTLIEEDTDHAINQNNKQYTADDREHPSSDSASNH
jgi:LysM repeat protein